MKGKEMLGMIEKVVGLAPCWVKTQGTLRAGEHWNGPAMAQLQPDVVDVWKHSCEKCGNSTTVFVTNPKEPIKAFCCGKWVTPEPEKKPQQERGNVLSRLLR